MADDVEQYIRAAKRQRWQVQATKKGRKLIPLDPSAPIVLIHSTPSDQRVARNVLAEMKRSGFIWPPK